MSTRIIHEKQDMRYLSWSLIRSSSGTAGSFLKATDDLKKPKVYYKLSNYDSVYGITGHECVNELIVDRLLNILGMEHLHYDLIRAEIDISGKFYDTYLCASEDFKARGEHKIALDVYYEAERHEGESPLDFCIRNGWGEQIYNMMVLDFLILNRDRHGANIEVLRNKENHTIRLAPIFDNGLSLLFNCRTEAEVNDFDVMEDKAVQCFVGSRSVKHNLELIPKQHLPKLPEFNDLYLNVITDGLNGVLHDCLTAKICGMIKQRWMYYEDFCNKG